MNDHASEHAIGRRGFIRAGAGGAAALATTGTDGIVAAQGNDVDYGGWFDDVDNFEGTVDQTGQLEAVVRVGAEGNGGKFAFEPPAIKVNPGTRVVWKWVGEGGQHNVVAEDGNFESPLTDKEGFTFGHSFEEGGVVRYYCKPHRGAGMKGAVAVENEGKSHNELVFTPSLLALGAFILLGLLSPIAFALLMYVTHGGREQE